MALSPTDFYAYSRATGTPFPEDAEERAQMAPEVLEFRRNQLKSKDEDFNVTNALGTVAALAGVGAGGFGLTRLLGRKTPIKKVYTPPAEAASVIEKISTVGVPSSKTVEQSQFTPRSYVEETGSVAPDLTSIQNQLDSLIIKQSVEASDPGLDQVVNRGIVIPSQRKVTGFKAFSENADRIERVSNEIQNFSQELTKINTANENALKTFNPYGMTEEDFEILGERNTRELERAYERGGRSISDLTGEIKVDPKIGRQLRKEGVVVRPGSVLQLSQFSDTPAREGVGVNRFTPDEILERTMAAASYPREIRDQILNPNVSREEIREFLGSTPKVRGGAVSINPTMEIAGGARASMPEAFVDELQTAGVGGVGLTYEDTANLPGLGQREKLERAGFVFDPNTGNYVQTIDDMEFEPDFLEGGFFNENATDYGDTEGVGNLLIPTETFKERTNKSTTLIPGAVERIRGLAGKTGTERQERVIDAVIPFRKDIDSEQTTGLRVQVDPESSFERQLSLRDIGYRRGGIINSEDTLTQGTKLVGGFEPAVANVSRFITTQPASDWTNQIKSPYISSQTGLMRGDDEKYYLPITKRLILDEEVPLLGKKLIPLKQVDPTTGQTKKTWGDHPAIKLEQLTLNRAELEEVAEAAKDAYFNNPVQKAAYLAKNNPEVLAKGRAEGLSLSEIGEAYDYQGFIINAVDDYLMNNKGIDLPILKQEISLKTGTTYFPIEAHGFITNLLKTEKNTGIYGIPVKTNERGVPLARGFKKAIDSRTGKEYETRYVDWAVEDVPEAPIPGRYQVRGSGGVDPMTLGDEGDRGNVAYQSPRIDTISQRKLLGILQKSNVEAGAAVGLSPSTQTGIDMTKLRGAMETPSTGEGLRRVNVRDPQTGNVVGKTNVPTMNIGSFARTQNPYTGVAAAAAGPASRAAEGNYQYPSNQLNPKLAPTRQLPLAGTGIRRFTPEQIDELNQFALTANLTPGGTVRQGALNLGGGLGVISTGIESLPSETATIQRYGITGGQLKQTGENLMYRAAQKKAAQREAASLPMNQEEISRGQATARHLANYITAAAQRLEGPETMQGVKLKGKGQDVLRPYQEPSEAMLQQLIRAYS